MYKLTVFITGQALAPANLVFFPCKRGWTHVSWGPTVLSPLMPWCTALHHWMSYSWITFQGAGIARPHGTRWWVSERKMIKETVKHACTHPHHRYPEHFLPFFSPITANHRHPGGLYFVPGGTEQDGRQIWSLGTKLELFLFKMTQKLNSLEDFSLKMCHETQYLKTL